MTLLGKPLSGRELNLVALLSEGKTVKEAAYWLGLSYDSAKSYAKRARQKLGADTTPQLVAMVIRDTSGNLEKSDIAR